MTSAELIAYLYDLGARLRLEGDQVRVTAPRGVLSEDIWRELKSRKDELRHWLQSENGDRRTHTWLKPQPRPEQLPLSYAQQRLWFLDQLGGGSTEYNMPDALRLRGAIDIEALQRTINRIVERHE